MSQIAQNTGKSLFPSREVPECRALATRIRRFPENATGCHLCSQELVADPYGLDNLCASQWLAVEPTALVDFPIAAIAGLIRGRAADPGRRLTKFGTDYIPEGQSERCP